jgi:hypothetical protein
MEGMDTPTHRWYHLTPDRFVIGLLLMQVFLLLSAWFQWFPFNEKKGWTLLIAVGVVGLAVLLMLMCGLVCLCLRWRFQFGVRSLLLFMVTVSIPRGWFAWEWEKARQQKQAVETIVEAGGSVNYSYGMEDVLQKPPAAAWLRSVLRDDFFCDVWMVTYAETSDCDVKHWQHLRSVEVLVVPDARISDTDLSYMGGLPHLEALFVERTKVTDRDVKRIEQTLPNCDIILYYGSGPDTSP